MHSVQDDNEICIDVWRGQWFQWSHTTTQRSNTVMAWNGSHNDEKRSYKLMMRQKNMHLLLPYLNHVIQTADEESKRNKKLKVRKQAGDCNNACSLVMLTRAAFAFAQRPTCLAA